MVGLGVMQESYQSISSHPCQAFSLWFLGLGHHLLPAAPAASVSCYLRRQVLLGTYPRSVVVGGVACVWADENLVQRCQALRRIANGRKAGVWLANCSRWKIRVLLARRTYNLLLMYHIYRELSSKRMKVEASFGSQGRRSSRVVCGAFLRHTYVHMYVFWG